MANSYHRCQIQFEVLSNSCIPRLPPQAGAFARFRRNFKKLFIVSKKHYNTKNFLRSNYMIIQERQRHLRTSHWYIIHPLSNFKIWLECIMSFVWIMALIADSLVIGFYSQNEESTSNIYILTLFFDVINIMFMLISFFIGK